MNTAERFRITASEFNVEFNVEEIPDVGVTVAITLKNAEEAASIGKFEFKQIMDCSYTNGNIMSMPDRERYAEEVESHIKELGFDCIISFNQQHSIMYVKISW